VPAPITFLNFNIGPVEGTTTPPENSLCDFIDSIDLQELPYIDVFVFLGQFHQTDVYEKACFTTVISIFVYQA